MEKDSGNQSGGVMFILGILYAWSVTFGVISCTIIPHNPLLILAQCAIVYSAVTVIFLNKYTRFISGAIFVLMAVFMTAGALRGGGSDYGAFMSGVVRFIIGYSDFTAGYGQAVVWGLSLLITVFAFIFVKVTFNYWILVVFGCSMFVLSIISGYFTGEYGFIAFLFTVLAFTVINFNLRIYGNPNKTASNQPHGVKKKASPLVLPICLMVIVVAAVIPLRPEKISLGQAVDDYIMRPYYAIRDVLDYMFEPKYFSFENTGFGGGSRRLGGDVELTNDFVMEVRSHIAPLYLKGAVNDRYTGFSWVNTRQQFTPYTPADIDESALAYWVGYWYESVLRPLLFLNQGNNADVFYEFYLSGTAFGFTYDNPLPHETDTFTVRGNRGGVPYTFTGDRDELLHTIGSMGEWGRLAAVNDTNLSRMEMFIIELMGASQRANVNREVRYSEITVDIRRRRTGTLFTPPNFAGMAGFTERGVETDDFSFIRVSPNGVMQTPRVMRHDTAYTLRFFEHNRNTFPFGISGRVADPLFESKAGYYARIMNDFERLMNDHPALRARFGISPETYLFRFNDELIPLHHLINDILIPRNDEIREIYLQLPEDLPLTVINYAHFLTDEYESEHEKALALTRRVSQFRYTLTPGAVPAGRDFVEYFLSEGQAGYCVYFASALTVMARAIGLPARYVEGYIVVSEPDEFGWRRVDNSNAHAWVEIYFEGYGWKLFEPTPTYSFINPAENDAREDPHEPDDRERPIFIWDEPWDDEDDDDFLFLPPRTGNQPPPPESGGVLGLLLYFIAAVSAFLLMGAGYTAARAMMVKSHLKKLRKTTNNAAASGYFKLILKYAKYRDFAILGHETPYAYADRIGEKLFFNNETSFMKDLAYVFTKSQYSGREVSDGERSLMARAYREFLGRVRSEMNWLRWVVLRYTLGAV